MMHKVNYANKFIPRDSIPDNNKRSCTSLSKMYMQTCCTHRNNQPEIYNFANSFENRFDSSRATVCVV